MILLILRDRCGVATIWDYCIREPGRIARDDGRREFEGAGRSDYSNRIGKYDQRIE